MSFLIASDALEIVKRTPTAPPAWRWLTLHTAQLVLEERNKIINAIIALDIEHPAGKWLQYSALTHLTGEAKWYWQQAAVADNNTAPDAIVNLITLAWFRALVSSADSATFLQFINGMQPIRLQRLAAANLPVKTARRRTLGPVQRIALYTPQVANSQHGGTTFTLNTVSSLLNSPVEVHIFSAQETSIPAADAYTGSRELVQPATLIPDTLALGRAGQSHFHLSEPDYSIGFRYRQMLKAIHEYDPDVVIFVGFLSPFMHALYHDYPVVALSVHAHAPAIPMDVWLAPEPAAAVHWNELTPPAQVHFPHRFWPQGIATPIDRAEQNLPEQAVLLVTAGHRLAEEIDECWAHEMISLLECHPDAHWLLIGQPPEAQWPSHSRIHHIGPQSSLPAWLSLADIYVCPPRVGGGGTVAMAMEQGTPVISLAGTDGGGKTGMYAAPNMTAYMTCLANWICFPEIRCKAGNAMRDMFTDNLDISTPAASQRLLDACNEAISLYFSRQELLNA